MNESKQDLLEPKSKNVKRNHLREDKNIEQKYLDIIGVVILVLDKDGNIQFYSQQDLIDNMLSMIN